jgi:hypothetical protein
MPTNPTKAETLIRASIHCMRIKARRRLFVPEWLGCRQLKAQTHACSIRQTPNRANFVLGVTLGEPNSSFRIFSAGQLQRNEPMKLAIALLAAGIGLATTAASAEETRIGVGVGPVGAGVTVGSGHDRDRDRERTTVIKRDAEPRERTTIIKKEHEEPDRKVIIKERD